MSDQGCQIAREDLLGYLYGEDEPEARARFEAHLPGCAACRAELDGLGDVRTHLASWAPPGRAIGFKIVTDPPSPVSWRAAAARWALPAAAVLVLAAAAAVANLEVRYDASGLTVRTGWARAEAPVAGGDAAPGALTAAAAEAPAAAPVDSAPWRTELASLEQRLRQELATPSARGAVPEAELLGRVRTLITESEQRQQRELALRMTQLMRDFDSQRRADLVRIEQGLGRIEGTTGAEVARQRELLNYLVRVSSQR